MKTFFDEAEDNVFYMQKDLYYGSNFLLYSDGSALKTLDIKHKKSYTIAGVSRNSNYAYAEGLGTGARFNWITSFEQLTKDIVLVTDFHNNCIRIINRSTNLTKSYAGKCGAPGKTDGSLTNARFMKPEEITMSPAQNILYICDGTSIRELNVDHGTVSTFQNISYTPISLVVDNKNENIYVSVTTRILQIDIRTKQRIYLSKSTESGYHDGSLKTALFESIFNFIFLNPQTILAVDSKNYRLRVIDLSEEEVYSICNGINFPKDGDANSCQLSSPLSVTLLKEESLILIGGYRKIRSLSISGNYKC